jgi:RHS repeat-associated protein
VKYYLANGQVVAQRSSEPSEGLQYLHGDHLGSSVAMTRTDGGVAFEGGYRPYGEDAYVTGSVTTRYRYTGQEKEASGLYYYHARYYDPDLGRFLQGDTVLDGINRYAYGYNNPIVYNDPTGHIPAIFIAALVAFVVFIVDVILPDETQEWIGDHVTGEINITVPVESPPTGGGGSPGGGSGGTAGTGGSGPGGGAGTVGINPELTPLSGTPGTIIVPDAGIFNPPADLPGGKAVAATGGSLLGLWLFSMIMPPTPPGGDDADMPEQPKPSTPGNMQKQVERGQAPGTVDRVEPARSGRGQPHIHFTDQRPTLNQDGTWGHGGPGGLSQAERDWISRNGWGLPE